MGKNPTDCGKLGTKRHIIVDSKGIPLAVILTGANVHDSKAHNVAWKSIVISRPSENDIIQHACEDKAYDSYKLRTWLSKRGYRVLIPYRGLDTAATGKYTARRWVVEKTGRWHNLFRRLKIRFEKKVENYLAFIHFANAVICFRSCK